MQIFTNKIIFLVIEKIINFINSIFFILLIVALTFALILSPPDYLQGDSVRIMYVHVPAAWIALASFSLISVLSIFIFIFKIKHFHLMSISIAPIGLMFTSLAIITGSIWGKPTWGTWWVWDARLTSMLALMFFYILFIISNKFIKNKNLSEKVCGCVAILGLINIPIIKYSVNWWNTLHQPASVRIDGTSTVDQTMMLPLLLMLLVLLIYAALIFLMKYKTEIIKMKRNNIKNL